MLRLTSATKFVAPSGRIVVFGIIDPDDLDILITPSYQRELLPVRSVGDWQKALYAGEVPPLDLGSHQSRTKVRNDGGITIIGDVNIIDGVQRRTAARLVRNQGEVVLLPVMVYLGTTYEWEVARFRVLNSHRRQVSTNVLLRNARQSNQAIDALYDMSAEERDSTLSGRVQWEQSQRPGNLLSAVSLVKVAAMLHQHFVKGARGTDVVSLAWALGDVTTGIPAEMFRQNVETFFQIIGKAINIAEVQKPRNIVQLTLGYMMSLASMLGEHADFWQESRLVLSAAAFDGLTKVKLDPISTDIVSTKGRVISGLAEKMAEATMTGRRKPLTRW